MPCPAPYFTRTAKIGVTVKIMPTKRELLTQLRRRLPEFLPTLRLTPT